MTWGEFKASVEKQGITDDKVIWFIDVQPSTGDKDVVVNAEYMHVIEKMDFCVTDS